MVKRNRTKIIQICGIILLALTAACATKYLGKIYVATQNVDVYLKASAVERKYTSIGSLLFSGESRSPVAVRQKVMEMCKARGADAVIIEKVNETSSIARSSITDQNSQGKIFNAHISLSGVKEKEITASFIKYD